MALGKTIRIFSVSIALTALLAFATGVVSDWNHYDSSDDAHCPYCHLGHQAPIEPQAAQCVSVLEPVAGLALPEDVVLAAAPAFSQTIPRAPPI
jgi:hypothetical protein